MQEIEPIEDERAVVEKESTTELIKDLLSDAQDLIREEAIRAKNELQREVTKAKSAGTVIGAGAVCGFIAGIVFAFTAVAALSLVLPMWLAGAIVTVVFAIAALVAVKAGVKKFRNFEPARALEPLKEEARWITKTVNDIQSHKRDHTLH
jgi:hypothetical protein